MKTRDDLQEDALTAIGNSRAAGIVATMRFGKCVLGFKHMLTRYHDTAKFLIVAPRKTIFESWKEDAKKHGFEYLLAHITFTTYISLSGQTYDYDVVYLDECHSLKFSYGDWLSIYQNHHKGTTIGLTGTYPVVKSSEKYKMCNRFCPKVYQYTTDEAVDDEILNDYRIVVHKLILDTQLNLTQKNKKGETWTSSELKQYEYWTAQVERSFGDERMKKSVLRMKQMQSFPSKIAYGKALFDSINDKVLIFANTQEQADKLFTHSFHAKNKNSLYNLGLFKKGEIMKLSCVDQLSEGVTIPGLKVGIILHAFGNNRKASQRFGRMLGLNPDETSTIHVLCYWNSIDRKWVEDALKHLDQSKISWIEPMVWSNPQ